MKKKHITKLFSLILIAVILTFSFRVSAYSEATETQTIASLINWYKDTERTSDTFTLTNNIICSKLLLLDATVEGGRTDNKPITIDTGTYSLIFSSSMNSSAYIRDNNLTIIGSSTPGAIIINRGKLFFSYGSIIVNGPMATGLMLNSASVISTSDRYSVNNAIVSASGEGATAVKIAENNSNITLNGMFISSTEGAIAIDSQSPIKTVYTKIDGNTNLNDNTITSFFSEISDQEGVDNKPYKLQYNKEMISFGDLPASESIQILDEAGIEKGSYLAPITWESEEESTAEDRLKEVNGSIETLVSPLEKKAYVYKTETTPDCSQEALLNWYNGQHEDGDTFVLKGDIFITDIDLLDKTTVPVTIDTGDYTLFIQSNLVIRNPNLTIKGKGENLGVVCINRTGNYLTMPEGGRIEATNGTAVCSDNNMMLEGLPTIVATGGPCIRAIGVEKFLISGAVLSGDRAIQAPESVTLVNCQFTGAIASNQWYYAVSDVPEGNSQRNVYSTHSYGVTFFDYLATKVGEPFDADKLAKTFFVKVKLNSGLVVNVNIPVTWDFEALKLIDTTKTGTYNINGALNNFGEEDLSNAIPTITIDVINSDKLTILGSGAEANGIFYRYKNIRLYFKLQPGMTVVSGDTFFNIEYALNSMDQGAAFGTIAPNTPGQEVGYWPEMITFPREGYGCILLYRESEYGMLDKEAYCFRIRTKCFEQQEGQRVDHNYYTDETWFPHKPLLGVDNSPDTQNDPPPSTPPSDDNGGTRGGSEREDGGKPDSQTITKKQLETIMAAGKQEILFIMGDVNIEIPTLVLKSLSGNATISAKQSSDNSFIFSINNDGKNINTLSQHVKITMPCKLSGKQDNIIAELDGKVITNGYYDEKTKKFIVNIKETGTITIEVASPITYSDTAKHWAKRAISFITVRDIAQGDGNGNFRPNDNVSKGEFVKLLEGCLSDGKIIYNAFDSGKITRAEIAVMLYKAYGADSQYSAGAFSDLKNQNVYVRNAVAFVNSKGYMSGTGKKLFSPDTYLTRAEASQIIYNIILGS